MKEESSKPLSSHRCCSSFLSVSEDAAEKRQVDVGCCRGALDVNAFTDGSVRRPINTQAVIRECLLAKTIVVVDLFRSETRLELSAD